MISIEGVSKSYGGTQVLHHVSFSAHAHEITGLIGPNGSGKSTLLRILLGLEKADSGTATFDGLAYARLGSNPYAKVGSFLDCCQPHPLRTGRSHLIWIAAAIGASKRRCDECLDLVGLAKAGRKKFKSYSLGMKQRLGLAAAILGDPEVLVLDEPINGLDPDGIKWVRTFLQDRAKEGRTVLLSSHYMAELEQTADNVVGLAQGQLVIDSPVRSLVMQEGSLEEAYFKRTSKILSDSL